MSGSKLFTPRQLLALTTFSDLLATFAAQIELTLIEAGLQTMACRFVKADSGPRRTQMRS